jgi:hypothetical protein
MQGHMKVDAGASSAFILVITLVCTLFAVAVPAEQVAVRYREGLVHGFLVLRDMAGASLADGELLQSARGDRVTSRLVFHFKDGSLLDETAVFSQRGQFRLITDRLIQKGRTFRQPIEMSIDVASGRVVVHYEDDDGEPKVADEHMELPADLANGMILTLLKNLRPNAPLPTLSMVAATPKPRLVKLALSSAGQDRFTLGRTAHRAIHYVVKVEIGGFAGLVAPIVGKQPEDSHVWILGGEAPAFVKSQGPMVPGGDIWKIELVSPAWPRTSQ